MSLDALDALEALVRPASEAMCFSVHASGQVNVM